MGGRTGTHPKLATKVMEDVPCEQLAKVLEFVTPYHTRQKMHPIKGKKYSKSWKQASRGSVKKQLEKIENSILEKKSS
jgi:ferredoxin-nitrite reductase